MKLTGKCKENFEKWLLTQNGFRKSGNLITLKHLAFDNYPKPMQYGLYVDFFDSCSSICIDTSGNCFKEEYTAEITFREATGIFAVINPIEGVDRNDARAKAITKANEIYNEKTSKEC